MTGFNYNKIMAYVHLVVFTIGVNLVFFPMHALGIAGMPRRIPDYPDGYAGWNTIISLGTIYTFISVLIFLVLASQLFKRTSWATARWS
jgi:cytochrome c oxidase subunit I